MIDDKKRTSPDGGHDLEEPPAVRTFGLTGNTGTGKSAVAERLRAHGVAVVDADEHARAVVEPGQPALAEIAATFGPHVLDANGRLRRHALGRLVFGDPDARRRLEALTHPRIAARVMAELEAHRAAGAELAVYDSALLVEMGQARAFAGLIVVTATKEQQLARIMARDGLSRADALQRIEAQMPLADKIALADLVIDNSGPLEDLDAKVDALVAWMRQKARVT
jgi:dephospho-CoA kinase